MVAALVAACHPGPTVAVTTVAALLGAGVGMDPAPLVLFTLAVLSGQLSVGWSNDAIDASRDLASGRTDKPAATGAVTPPLLWRAATIAAAATMALSVLLGAGAVQLLLPAAGWAYNLGLKATWFSGAAYAVGFAALPAAPFLMLDGAPAPPWWAPTAGALLGIGAHVANVLPDLTDDLATDVRGLPHRLGVRASVALMAGTLFAAVLVTAFGPADADLTVATVGSVAGLVLAALAVTVSWRRPGSRAAFPLVMGLALLAAVLFAAGT